MTVSVVVPGSFDPITLGHLDIVRRACERFDHVTVAVLENPRKQGLFSVDERLQLIRAVVGEIDNLAVERFEGLLVDFCRAHDIGIICKGLRAVSDFEYELQMAQMNRRIGGIETVFMSTSPEHSYLSSSLVKEVARYGGPLDGTVPDVVADALRDKFAAAGG
ncbi:pantetheine-phosphate adenylyltransferase [Egicoccus sp. AB-alg2]|uniref:pantetheine-phosphate adenylyltransferase n=1 Tax=Egicoccus sp. AB-alg2 TaxID=3242693 RepID=UPI00359CF4A3